MEGIKIIKQKIIKGGKSRHLETDIISRLPFKVYRSRDAPPV
jgi:hypothetical protein